MRDNIWINPCEDKPPLGEVNGEDRCNRSPPEPNGDFDCEDTPCEGQQEGNGYIDDIVGYDFGDGDADPSEWLYGGGIPNTHGTLNAGVIAARGDNGIGVVGVNWSAKIVVLKIFPDRPVPGDPCEVALVSTAVAALEYCIRHNIRVSNNSWTVGLHCQSLYNAIKSARDHGHLFVVGAGNWGTNNDLILRYPTNYGCTHMNGGVRIEGLDNVIAVAATDNDDNVADFGHVSSSNYGANCVHLAAPGLHVHSTTNPDNHGLLYDFGDGTSIAAPHVAGVVALVWSQFPDWDYLQVKNRVLSTVRKVDALRLSGPTPVATEGVVNAYRAVFAPAVPAGSDPKVRFLSLRVPEHVGPTAVRVKLVDLQNPNPPNPSCCPPQDFSAYESATCSTETGEANGCTRWVGPVWTFQEKQDVHSLGTFRAARLQCTPFYHDWSTEGDFHVTGAEIMPSSTYDVQVFAGSCLGVENTCVYVSCPLTLTTARWGDVAYPWNPPATTDQPDVGDVGAVVDKFKGLLGSPSNTRALLGPSVLYLTGTVGGPDIVATVDAFKGLAYPYSGPCPCPSPVPCETQSCGPITDCSQLCVGGSKNGQRCEINCDCCPGDGVCQEEGGPHLCAGASPPVCAATNGLCVKTCLGGPNAGQPCTEARDCNYCSGGTSVFVPCDPSLPSQCFDGPCGERICSVGKIGDPCAVHTDCNSEMGTCNGSWCFDGQGTVCGYCDFGQQNCHCDGICGDVRVAVCGTGYCRDRCGRCN